MELVGRNKRILIVYDTRGGTTNEVVGWIMDGAMSAGAYVEARTPKNVDTLDYDLIVIGSPIYNEEPMGSISDFMAQENLRGKKIALFVVCFAGVFGMRNFMVRKYLDELKGSCAGNIIYETSFDAAMGPWRKLNRAICFDFGKELAGPRRPTQTPLSVI
ncbi:hypothetical protein CUJ83_00140 [Methanocella sp. CWC-04]|uniref:Flavodoxin domain-containing protein n=1 Tax=Methanooceanicella nereidis TaxID=2052831 RepID=A0AAP2RAF4_9EURY|nr:flavodoxin domain-containing protein [Methanocella sp. CWC-04]MCD1293407.1 hypothetical protein [Methanocella sp. CWC-04]